MFIRLNKFLSEAGVCSRRTADEHILAGRVRVNDITAKLGDKVDPEKDKVELNGKSVRVKKQEFVYYALYKPCGVISTSSDEKGRQNVAELVPETPRVYPVGRLDRNSEGLILLTNDGEFANEMMHPSHEISKEYEVLVRTSENSLTLGKQKKFLEKIKSSFIKGFLIDDKPMKVDRIEINTVGGSKLLLKIVIHTGYNRQIRKMCAKMDLRVVSLKRIRIGDLSLKKLNLKPKEFCLICKSDLASR